MIPLKIDICAYDAPDNVGGPLVWIQRLPILLQDMGFDISVNLFSWQSPKTGYAYRVLKDQGVAVQSTLFRDTATNIRWLLKLADARRPDVFIANHVVPAYYAGKYLKKAGIATIGILRSDDPFYRAIARRFVYSGGHYQVSAVVCVSEYLCKMVEKNDIHPLIVRQISSGTPTPLKQTTRPTDTLKIVYVGRIVEEQKQVSLLTRALIRVVSEVHGVEATLYGDGPAREDVEQIIASAETKMVRYAGKLPSDEIQQMFLKSHVVVLLSDYEGLPVAILEAMACGVVPVCLQMRSGISELVEDGVTGLVIEDRENSFVEAIRRLKGNTNLWSKLSLAARGKVEEHYSIQKCAKQWAELLIRLHNDADMKKKMRHPRGFLLPPVQPELAAEDPRLVSVPLFKRIYVKGRMIAGYLKLKMVHLSK